MQSLQARIIRERDVLVVFLTGRIDVEAAEPFRAACMNYLDGKQVVFDFAGLGFVGSSGILPFLQTMQEFAARNERRLMFSSVGSEFRKVLSATSLAVVEVHETSALAVDALLNPRPVVVPVAAVQAVPMQSAVEVDDAGGEEPAAAQDFGLLNLNPLSEAE